MIKKQCKRVSIKGSDISVDQGEVRRGNLGKEVFFKTGTARGCLIKGKMLDKKSLSSPNLLFLSSFVKEESMALVNHGSLL